MPGKTLTQIIYMSSAVHECSEEQLSEILAVCRANNEKTGVTGLLIYCEQFFVQALEGESEAVQATFARIGRDPRHKRIVLLMEHEVTEREFGEWSMGFPVLSDEEWQKVEGYTPFFAGLAEEGKAPDPGLAKGLLNRVGKFIQGK